MLGQPAGWFQDPAPRDPVAPDTWRYWNGTAWTAQTRTGSKRQRREWREEAAVARVTAVRDLVDRAEEGDEEAQWQLDALSAAPDPGTGDGQRFGGWWARFGANFVDSWIVSLVATLLAFGLLRRIIAAVPQYVDAATAAAQRGDAVPSVTVLLEAIAGPLLAAATVALLTSLVFEVGFLKGCQATPGKLLFGLRVRPDDLPGPLSWRAVLLRWSGKSGVSIVQLVPFGVLLYGVYALLDYLWPLGDRDRQALHDKLARTYVVRRA